MTKRGMSWQGIVVISGTLVLAVWLGSAVWAQPNRPPSSSMLLGEYGSAMNWGEYEGILYCLRHDFSQDKKDKEICKKEGRHRHVLMMANGHVHPLYGQTEELNTLINSSDVNAKKVKIKGKYYVTTNAILAESLQVIE